MRIWDWLTGNSMVKRNNVKIARVKKELQFITIDQKTARLKQMKDSGHYPFDDVNDISDIQGYSFDLASDFLIYYFLRVVMIDSGGDD